MLIFASDPLALIAYMVLFLPNGFRMDSIAMTRAIQMGIIDENLRISNKNIL